jgi:hypothetical protein
MPNYIDVGKADFLQIIDSEALETQGWQIHGSFHRVPMPDINNQL